MRSRFIRVLEAFDRVSNYFATTPPWTAEVPAPANVATQLTTLDIARAALRVGATGLLSGQNTARRQTQVISTLRRSLNTEQLTPLRYIARATFADQPGLVHQFGRPTTQVSTTRLLQAAAQITQDAAPYTALFIANGLPANFLSQLTVASKALQLAITAREAGYHTRSSASAAIPIAIGDGRKAVRYLDAIMRSCFGNNAEVLAGWRQTRRVRQLASGVSTASSQDSLTAKAA